MNWLNYRCVSDARRNDTLEAHSASVQVGATAIVSTPANYRRVVTDVETMLSPARAMFVMAMNCAACPLEVATAAAPPSSAAIRFSNTSCSDPPCFGKEITRSDKNTHDRGIPDARVDVPKRAQTEQICSMLQYASELLPGACRVRIQHLDTQIVRCATDGARYVAHAPPSP